eukprot:3158511-Rhodomonas_salina.1
MHAFTRHMRAGAWVDLTTRVHALETAAEAAEHRTRDDDTRAIIEDQLQRLREDTDKLREHLATSDHDTRTLAHRLDALNALAEHINPIQNR